MSCSGSALTEALRQVSGWEADGLSLGVSVNLAPATLARPDCVRWVRDALRATGVAPGRLCLEITEDQALSETDETSAATLVALAQLGVSLAMDDLGSGYSSLRRLRALPFRVVKLDQGLVHGVLRSPVRTVSFIGALVQLGRDLEIEVVVEGLESPDMVEAAALLGADVGQGFSLGRPMPAEALAAWARDFTWTVDRHLPRTPLGALATDVAWQPCRHRRSGAAGGLPGVALPGRAGVGREQAGPGAPGSACARGQRRPPQPALPGGLRAVPAGAGADDDGGRPADRPDRGGRDGGEQLPCAGAGWCGLGEAATLTGRCPAPIRMFPTAP